MAISRRLNDLPVADNYRYGYAETPDGKQVRVPGLNGVMPKMSIQEYYALKNSGKIENRIYSIYKDNELQSIYIGETLVMRKAKDGETPTFGGVFPLVFPIIFT